jgi:hypothetical protein
MIFLLLQDLKSELSSANTTSAEFPNTIELSVENVCKKNNIFFKNICLDILCLP